MSKPDGGPAFPPVSLVKERQGMSLRDYFAAAALQGLLAADGNHFGIEQCDPKLERAAMLAFKAADAMLEERDK